MKNTKLLALVILIIALSAALYSFWSICMTFFVAMVIAYLLNPLAKYMSAKSKMPHGLACVLVLFLFIVALALLVSFFVPFAITQLRDLVGDLMGFARSFDALIESLLGYLTELGLPQSVVRMAEDLLSRSDTFIVSVFTTVLSTLVNMSLGIFDLIVTVILIVYFMIDGVSIARGLLSHLPKSVRRRGTRMAREADALTKRYIKSRVLISSGMALVTYIGLMVMGIRYALLFALMAFVLDFVPYFGSLLAGAIVVFYALVTSGPGLALAVCIFVLVVQQVEGNVIAPRVEGEATGLHPVIVMFSLLACNRLFGPMGMLISTPIAAAVKLVVKEIFQFITEPDGYDPDQLELDP